MSEHADTHGHGDRHSISHYKKIGAILVVLAIISVLGPEAVKVFGLEGTGTGKLIVLFTAFGIAFIKAFLVIKNFMHLDTERAYIRYLFGGMLGMMVLFFFFTSADVMQHKGTNWQNVAAQGEVEIGMKTKGEFRARSHGAEHGEGHGDGHGEAHGDGHDAPADDHKVDDAHGTHDADPHAGEGAH